MHSSSYKIISLTLHKDTRGTLFEILRFKDLRIPANGYIYTFTINPKQIRGGHYHKKKREWFSCVLGKITVFIEDKKGRKKKIILDSSKPSVVYCSPNVFHSFLNDTNSVAVMVSYGSIQHNPLDPDTFLKYKYEEKK